MKRQFLIMLALAVLALTTAGSGQQPRFRVLAFYSTRVEPDHGLFAESAIKFFSACATKGGFAFDATTSWDNLNDEYLKPYQLVMWLNDSPTAEDPRRAFERYMNKGGAWLGFHAAGYNDEDTKWPWFVNFMGGTVFHSNSWPPLPAKLVIDDATDATAARIPQTFESPSNEWYVWKPSPRLNRDVRILATLDPSNYPIGLKDVITSADLPVVWTNTKYKMIYMNMGHGDKIFTSSIQNQLIENATTWLGTGSASADPVPATGRRISPDAVAVNPKTGKAYVVNSSDGSVTVIDSAGHFVATKVGTEPDAIAINPITDRIYVANEGSGTVSVIDGSTDKVVATVKVGDLPYAIAASPASNKIYISRTFGDRLTVIDGATNLPSFLKAGMLADAMAVNATTNRVYLLNYESKNVTVLDGGNDRDTPIAAEIHLWGIAVNSAADRIYVTGTGSSSVIVIDGKNNKTTAVSTGGVPCAVAVDLSTRRAYVTNYETNSVTVIDGTSNSVLATIKVGSRPQGIAVDSTSHRVYVANTHSDTVTVIDGTNNSVISTLKAGGGPYAIAVDSATHRAFVVGLAGGSVTVIDGRTLAGTKTAMPSAD